MPIDKFGRNHLSHHLDDSVLLVEELPKLFYETRLVLHIKPNGNRFILSDGNPSYKVYLPTGVITYISNPWVGVQMFINGVNIEDYKTLIGFTLSTGDVITFKRVISWDTDFLTVELGLRIPVSIE